MKKRVLVPLAQGCEELEAVTIMDLLVRAGVDVVSASLDDNLVITASRKTKLLAQTSLSHVIDEDFDLIVLPGGLPGADYLAQDPRLTAMLKRSAQNNALVAAVCAAPKVLVAAGLLEGKTATSYPGVIDATPAKDMVFSNAPVVVDGNIITSRGPGTVMDFSLTLIELLVGRAQRDTVEASLVR